MLEHYTYCYSYKTGNPARNQHGQTRYLWLIEHFGPVGIAWTWRINNDLDLEFYFKSQKDYTLFSLTWG